MDPIPASELLPLVYEELRVLARQKMALEQPNQVLQPTALVHEAYLRIMGDREEGWASRAQFYAAAAEAMHRILIESARTRNRAKNGGALRRIALEDLDLEDIEAVQQGDPGLLLAVEDAYQRLRQEDAHAADVVQLRYFAGLSEAETAAVLSISDRSVRREWAYARAKLYRFLKGA